MEISVGSSSSSSSSSSTSSRVEKWKERKKRIWRVTDYILIMIICVTPSTTRQNNIIL